MKDDSCSTLSFSAGETLAGTAGRADAFLLLEVRGAWEREALDGLAAEPVAAIRSWLESTPRSKVLFIRQPGRRAEGVAAFIVRAAEEPPSIRRFHLAGHEDLRDIDLDAGGEPFASPLVLVCGHGRRDACCARLGRPLYDALRDEFDPESLWLSSHQGGHRFAPNLLWLPDGLLFGRVVPAEAGGLVAELRSGRLPVEWLRGRTTFPPDAQAAEIAVRAATGVDGLRDIGLVAVEDGRVTLATPAGAIAATVEVQAGPTVLASCGTTPEPVERYLVGSIAS